VGDDVPLSVKEEVAVVTPEGVMIDVEQAVVVAVVDDISEPDVLGDDEPELVELLEALAELLVERDEIAVALSVAESETAPESVPLLVALAVDVAHGELERKVEAVAEEVDTSEAVAEDE
jgi:hypothetical protein